MINIIMLSGGIDSTALLIKYLKETNYFIHVHHIILKNYNNRWRAEKRAVKNIIEYCRNNYRRFGFSCSRIDIPDFKIGFTGLDVVTAGFTAGMVVRAMQNQFIHKNNTFYDAKYLVSATKSDFPNGLDEMNSAVRMTQSKYMFKLHFLDYRDLGYKIPERIYPIIDYTKEDLYNKYIPEELKEYVWTCRTPSFVGNEIVPCGMCAACQIDFNMRGVKDVE